MSSVRNRQNMSSAFQRMTNFRLVMSPATHFQDIVWDLVAAVVLLVVSGAIVIFVSVLDRFLNLGLLEANKLGIAIILAVPNIMAMVVIVYVLVVGVPASLIRSFVLLAKA